PTIGVGASVTLAWLFLPRRASPLSRRTFSASNFCTRKTIAHRPGAPAPLSHGIVLISRRWGWYMPCSVGLAPQALLDHSAPEEDTPCRDGTPWLSSSPFSRSRSAPAAPLHKRARSRCCSRTAL